MRRKLPVLKLIIISMMFLVAVNPVLARKSRGQYDLKFAGGITGITGDSKAEVLNQWSMGIYGKDRITLTFKKAVVWGDFAGTHSGELGLHTKDKGETVQIGFSLKMQGYQHAHVLKATGTVSSGTWMGNEFTISFSEAKIFYKSQQVWRGTVSFTITCTRI